MSESLDSVILFLKNIVPNEADNAKKKLKQLVEALEIMERMKAGKRMALIDSDPAAVAKEWRDVAEQYQSAFDRISHSLPPLSSPSAMSNSPPPYNGPPPYSGPPPHSPLPHRPALPHPPPHIAPPHSQPQ